MQANKANLGTLISGTHKSEDLLPAFLNELYRISEGMDDGTVEELAARYELLSELDEEHPDEEFALIADLMDTLNDYAPPYAYFGAHPGDGADYGFWVDEDIIGDDAVDDELLRVNDLSEVPEDWAGNVLVVNDHGNMTLYASKITHVEQWSIV